MTWYGVGLTVARSTTLCMFSEDDKCLGNYYYRKLKNENKEPTFFPRAPVLLMPSPVCHCYLFCQGVGILCGRELPAAAVERNDGEGSAWK